MKNTLKLIAALVTGMLLAETHVQPLDLSENLGLASTSLQLEETAQANRVMPVQANQMLIVK